jgi:CYTH domain-containing protein
MTQGYLSSDPARTVRVRIRGDQGFLTIKGPSSANGLARFEWEQTIPLEDAGALLLLCEPGMIDKTRFIVPCGRHNFEVDVFHGDNDGLVVAEIELGTEDEHFDQPDWLGEEVTDDARYYNAMLTRNPFRQWS